jgi:glycosyltransferase involved in cell wall biosynthesis
MKVLLVSDYGRLAGGVEQLAVRLRASLQARGHDCRFFASSAQFGPSPNLADQQCFGTVGPFRTLLQTFNPFAYLALRRLLVEWDPDVVHLKMFLTQISPWILFLLRERPTLIQIEWLRAICPKGTKLYPDGRACTENWGKACYQRGCLKLSNCSLLTLQRNVFMGLKDAADMAVAPSRFLAQAVSSVFGPVHVVPNGVQPSETTPMSPRPKLAFVGRLVKEKGLQNLVSAYQSILPDYPSLELTLIGDGPLRDWLNEELQFTPARLLGHLGREEIEEALKGNWIQVVPSLVAEGFGLSAAEAMMRGTAVVCARSGALQEIVDDGVNGLLYSSQSTSELERCLRLLLADRELCRELGTRAREKALSEYDEESVTTRFLELYAQLQQKPKVFE